MNSNSPEVRALVQAFADKLSQVCPWLLFPYYLWNFLLSSTWNPFSALIDWIHFCVYSRVWRSFGMYIRTWMSNCLSVCLLACLPVSVCPSICLDLITNKLHVHRSTFVYILSITQSSVHLLVHQFLWFHFRILSLYLYSSLWWKATLSAIVNHAKS